MEAESPMAYSSDGAAALLCTVGDGGLCLMDLMTGKPLQCLRGQGHRSPGLEMNRNCTRAVSADGAGMVCLWDLERVSLFESLKIPRQPGALPRYSVAGNLARIAATTEKYGALSIWKPGEPQPLSTVPKQ